MKKIILLIITVFFSISVYSNTSFANGEEGWTTSVITTQKIPWANCEPLTNTGWKNEDNNDNLQPVTWKCEVWQWASTVISMLWDIIKYFTYLAWLVWVLFIVYNGILYSMWWADQSLKEESKKRIIWTIIWLIVLFLSGPILQIIAPWIYK